MDADKAIGDSKTGVPSTYKIGGKKVYRDNKAHKSKIDCPRNLWCCGGDSDGEEQKKTKEGPPASVPAFRISRSRP